jgi:hypothetical protein
MNVEKARQYFSGYYEKTLDTSLREAFERALIEDDQIAAEYREFEKTYHSLNLMSQQSVEVPDDLFERISARLDKSIWESKQKQNTGWLSWFRWASVGVAALAVLGLAIVQSNNMIQPQSVEAGILNLGSVGSVMVKPIENGVTVSHPAGAKHSIRFFDVNGKLLEQVDVDGMIQMRDKPLKSADGKPQLLSIQVDDQPLTWVALPGKSETIEALTSGSLQDFALYLASSYQTPIVLKALDVSQPTSWKKGATIEETALSAFPANTIKVELQSNNGHQVLWIKS